MGENGDVALKEIGEPFHVLAADALGPGVVAPHGGDHLRESAHRSADAVEPLASVPLQIRQRLEFSAERVGDGAAFGRGGNDAAHVVRVGEHAAERYRDPRMVAIGRKGRQLRRAAADIDERACCKGCADGGADEPEVGLLAGGEHAHLVIDGRLDGRGCRFGIRAVAQHGGGEDIDARAVEVVGQLQQVAQHGYGSRDARVGERPVGHVGGKAGHLLLVDQRAEGLGGIFPLGLVNDQANRIGAEVDNAEACHEDPFSRVHSAVLP